MTHSLVKMGVFLALGLVASSIAIAGFLVWQGRRTPTASPVYVALGSSFAAGAGLGPLQPGSPLLCARSVAGYPQLLARQLGLPIVDMSCGGAITKHLIKGGQYFQGPQIRVIDARTRLVTITVGGNDIGLVGDLSMLALRHSRGLAGAAIRAVWKGPEAAGKRDYAKLGNNLLDLIQAIHQRAPRAAIVVATYPAILPTSGTCARLRLSAAEADLMRPVERALADTTRSAAQRGGAILVDMHALGKGHDACSASPWVNGWTRLSAAPFHPNLAGANATAEAIAATLRSSPAAVAAIGEDDAAGHQASRLGPEA